MRTYTKKIFLRFLLVVTCLIGAGERCFAQLLDIKFDHLTTENGLAQNTVTGIVKDKYGFMWFGTWAGLCRYDGYDFKVYKYDPRKTNSLINNKVYNVSIDDNKDLWVVTFNDSVVCKYRYETDDFQRIASNKLTVAFKRKISRNGHLINAAVSYKGNQWDLDKTAKDLVQKNLTTGEILRYKTNLVNRWAISDQFATDLYLDNQHILWVGTYSNGINRANLDAKPFRYVYHDPRNSNSIIDNNVRTIGEDLLGNIWVGTRSKGVTMVSKNGTYRHFKEEFAGSNHLTNNYIKKIFCDSRGYVWIGTYRGLNGFDPKTGTIKQYNQFGLRDTHVFGIAEDHLGNIWIASWEGVFKYDPKKEVLIRQNAPGLPNKSVMTIMEDSAHRIWVGTEAGGVVVFKPISEQDLQLVDAFKFKPTGKGLSDNWVYSLYEDAEKLIWIGTGNGLDCYDPRKRSFKHFTASANGLGSSSITGIVEDDKNCIWVSHTKGLSKINKRKLTIRNFSTQDGLQGNEFLDAGIFKSKRSGMLYFGGNKGYNMFYPEEITMDSSSAKVVLTELQVLDRRVGVNDTINGRVLLTRPLYLSKEIELNHLDRSIAIEFAALHFTNPSANKYAYMLEGFDKDWIYTDAANRSAVYSNLSRGHYTFKVRAANSDGVWNNVATELKIDVSPPWWASTLAYVAYAIAIMALLYAFYNYSLSVERLKNKLAYENLLHEKEIELHQSKIDFFTNISHEIKTPLSLILAPIERMMSFEALNQVMLEQLSTMKKSGDRLLKLINQLLDIRRLETGNEVLRPVNEDMVSFLKRIIGTFVDLAKERGITLRFDTAFFSLPCSFDLDKMEKVMYNLLSNAFKFTPHNGHIAVRLWTENEQDKEWIFIEVSDDGLLITEEDFERIFKPFQQADSHQKGGTGLGLAYSKSLMELHGGAIMVKSSKNEREEIETAFTLKLPLVASVAPVVDQSLDGEKLPLDDASSETAEVNAGNSNSPVILIVEDDPDLRAYLVEFFSHHYQVLAASDGVQGLEIAHAQVPDLVISDMMMPEMDGLELLKRLKAEASTSHIPIILLTARTPIEFQVKGAEYGADDFMTKPFNLQLLLLKVKNLLQIRQTLQEKYKGKMVIQPAQINPVSPDEKLLKKILAFVEEKIGDPELDVAEICDSIGLSRTQLYRKMKALTGLSMAEIIRDIRLERAKQLLTEKKFNVNEICYLIGFTDVDYFRRIFKAKVGVSPSAYAKESSS